MKKIAIFLGAPSLFLFLLMFVGAAAGGGAPTAAIMPIVATEEKAEEYATVLSKLGAPWDIVLITDAIQAYDEGETGVEDVNPLYTGLQFQILTETKETYQIVSSSTDPDTGETVDTYDWVVVGSDRFEGRNAILAYAGVTLEKTDTYRVEQLTAALTAVAAAKSSDEVRYSVKLAVNSAFESVLITYVGLDEATTGRIMDLYAANYVEIMNLSEDAKERIRAIEGEYGVYQFVDGAYVNCEGMTFTDGGREVIYYNQLDKRWAALPYGKVDTIGAAGCGPTAMSIVISTLTSNMVDPVIMSNWAYENGYCCPNSGSYRTLISGAGEAFGLTVENCEKNEAQRVVDALAEGKLVVVIMAKGHFTQRGHFIVLRGVTESGEVLVADPASTSRSQRKWKLSLVLSEASSLQCGAGPLWIIG